MPRPRTLPVKAPGSPTPRGWTLGNVKGPCFQRGNSQISGPGFPGVDTRRDPCPRSPGMEVRLSPPPTCRPRPPEARRPGGGSLGGRAPLYGVGREAWSKIGVSD